MELPQYTQVMVSVPFAAFKFAPQVGHFIIFKFTFSAIFLSPNL
jgi:hypothetical protein